MPSNDKKAVSASLFISVLCWFTFLFFSFPPLSLQRLIILPIASPLYLSNESSKKAEWQGKRQMLCFSTRLSFLFSTRSYLVFFFCMLPQVYLCCFLLSCVFKGAERESLNAKNHCTSREIKGVKGLCHLFVRLLHHIITSTLKSHLFTVNEDCGNYSQ